MNFNPYHDQYMNKREPIIQNSLENLNQSWMFCKAKDEVVQ